MFNTISEKIQSAFAGSGSLAWRNASYEPDMVLKARINSMIDEDIQRSYQKKNPKQDDPFFIIQ